MCGIVAMLAKKQRGFLSDDVSMFWQMLVVDSLRGADGTGVWGTLPSGNVSWTKIGGNPYALGGTVEFTKWEERAKRSLTTMVGHNRYATSGGVQSPHAHPFVHEHIIMVHNGAIYNHASLRPDAPKNAVDSESIAHVLAREPDVVKAIESLEGAYAIVWYNAKEMKTYFVHNEERPLHYVETDDNIYLMSEDNALEFVALRNNIDIGTVGAIPVATDKIFCWDHKTLNMTSMAYKPYLLAKVVEYENFFRGHLSAPFTPDRAIQSPPPDTSTTFERFVKAVPIGSTITIPPARVVPWDIPQEDGRRLEGEAEFEDIKVIYKYSSKDIGRMESLGQARFVTGTVVSHLLATNHIAVWLKDVKESAVDSMWRSFNGINVTFKEWKRIYQEVKCRNCKKDLTAKSIKLTSLQYKKGQGTWSAVCPTCTVAAFNAASDVTKTLIEAKAGFDVIAKAKLLGVFDESNV